MLHQIRYLKISPNKAYGKFRAGATGCSETRMPAIGPSPPSLQACQARRRAMDTAGGAQIRHRGCFRFGSLTATSRSNPDSGGVLGACG